MNAASRTSYVGNWRKRFGAKFCIIVGLIMQPGSIRQEQYIYLNLYLFFVISTPKYSNLKPYTPATEVVATGTKSAYAERKTLVLWSDVTKISL
ncbi:hypothetical protein ACX27_25895 [Nostoc piscinale CENA21]|uniref:Uncharacterized protein n=1 Tax=Nostoc piscinale CENA21 TaxID=224013 RepID=A0A0M3V6I3_9NOSO|nr:hypothetical protein ACX27_25895 [Nostoc piscinale CENA21]